MTLKFIKKYYRKYLILFIIGILADIAVDFVQLFLPEFLGQLVEIVSNTVDVAFNDIRNIVLSVIGVAFALFIGRLIMRFSILTSSGKIEADMRKEMFLKAERLSQHYYHEHKVGDIMSWFASDIESVEEFAGWGTIMIVDALFLSGMALYKMINLNIVLSIIAAIPLFALIIWGNKVEKTMSQLWEDRQKNFDKLYDFTHEIFAGIRVIKAFVKQQQEYDAFCKVAEDQSNKNLEFAKHSIEFDVYIELIIGIMNCSVILAGSYFIYRYTLNNPVILFGYTIDLTAGKLITFLGYIDIMIWPMIAMGQILQMHSRFITSFKRINNFLDEVEEINDSKSTVVLQDCKGKVEFRNFNFQYPDGKAHSLENISFTINPGEMVGIVGKIGSGKTTLVNSLLRLYNIEENTIFIDDKDVMKLNIKSIRDNIAYVPQDNFLFSDNIKNNIAFSNKSLNIEEIKLAAKFADVDDNITDFDKGYETLTGERGVTLSGGQKQRISIARAYIKDSPIMIMDDSVSAVDIKTEETILNNIKEKRKNKTTIIIASRVSTVSSLDKIVVLNDGKVEAYDTPEKLLEVSPTYKKMVYLQKLESEL